MDIESFLSQVDIVELIRERVELKKVGKQYRGLCPFHEERTPSFYVSPDLGLYHCFGCGASGNAITFVKEMEGLTFKEAVEYLAQKFNIEIEWTFKQDTESRKDILEEANRFFRRKLLESEQALNYLKSRGVDDASVEKFSLGYAPKEVRSLTDYLLGKGFGMDRILESSLAQRKGDTFVDFFRNRIIFPVYDHLGRSIIAFSGRTLSNEEPKYINSPESPIFKKGETLYAFNLARKHISRTAKVILVEGQMDVIAMHQMGYENTVASMGTSLTDKAVAILRRLAKEAFIIYDADRSGMKATFKAMKLLLSKGIVPFVYLMPDGRDPGDYMKEGRKLDKVYENSYNISQIFALLYGRMAKVESKAKVVREFLNTLNFLKDDILKTMYIRQFEELTGMKLSQGVRREVSETSLSWETMMLWLISKEEDLRQHLNELEEGIFRHMLTRKILRLLKQGDLKRKMLEDEELMKTIALIENLSQIKLADVSRKELEEVLRVWKQRSLLLKLKKGSDESLEYIVRIKRREEDA